VGRVSAGYRARKETERRLAALREQLRAVVAAEEYERAAALRDEIRGLEATL
jgi:protein-arginine kinase activator protein McsA